MASPNALPEALRTYLATCSSEHANQIIETLRQSADMKANNGPGSSKLSKRQRSKKAKREKCIATLAAVGPKRPLNSWMAFRKYYNGSLAPLTQKAISKVLMTWWREDPFTAKWAILAKSYSVLRGSREKDEAPLDIFLQIAVPIIGIVPPELYQQMMGWQVLPPGDGDQEKLPQVARLFLPKIENFDDHYTTTTLSVDEVIEHCKRAGYLNDSTGLPEGSDAQCFLTMAVQLTTTIPTFATGEVEARFPTIFPQTSSTHDVTLASMIADGMPFTNAPADAAGNQALAAATVAVTEAGVYPYNNLFDPTTEFDVAFNPNARTDGLADGGLFDAYDLTTNLSVDDVLNLDWNQYVNDESMT